MLLKKNIKNYKSQNDRELAIAAARKMIECRYLGVRPATMNSFGILEFFYPPLLGIDYKCCWVDKNNGNWRIGSFDPRDIREICYYDLSMKVIAHFHKSTI